MHQLAILKDSQSIDATVDEIIETFNQLVDCGNITGNIHTYFSGCYISFEMLRKLKKELLSLSDYFFFRSTAEAPALLIQVADFTEDSCRITHLSRDGKWYVFEDGYSDIYLSLSSKKQVAV